MVQQVDVNGTIHEFPDEASPEMIQHALSSESQSQTQSGGQSGSSDNPEMVDTFLGKMPKHLPQLEMGTPEHKELIDNMIGAAAGAPGMQVVGKGAGAGLNLLKRFIQRATQSAEPLEKAAQQAGTEFNVAEKEAAVPKSGALISNPVTQLENLENEIGKHVNIEGAHDVKAAEAIKNRVKSVEDFWSDTYKKFEDKVKDNQFHMPEQAMSNIGYDMDSIMQRLKAGGNPKTVIKDMEREAAAQENPFYKHLVSKAPTAKDTNAGDFLAKYRDFRDTMGGLKQDLKSEKYGSMEKERIRDAINQGKDMESQIKETLNQGLGEYKPEFDWINRGYSEQVFPLRKNPIVKAARQGKLSSNIMNDLRTNESGMPLLRDMVKQDPELLRNIVGQRYKIKPGEVFSPNETMRSYLDEMPEFKGLLQQKEKLIKDTSLRKDISLKEKIKAENMLKEMMEGRSAARKKVGYGAASVLGGAVGVPAVTAIGRFLTKESNQ